MSLVCLHACIERLSSVEVVEGHEHGVSVCTHKYVPNNEYTGPVSILKTNHTTLPDTSYLRLESSVNGTLSTTRHLYLSQMCGILLWY